MLAESAEVANSPLSRLIGLLGRPRICYGQGLVITHTRSIHMVFMRFAIDAVFADKDGKVVGLVKNIRPFGFSPYFWRAHYVVELPPGVLGATRTEKGDVLQLLD